MREISIAEFFERNRHLLGFDSRKKALYTTVKEILDNSLDALEEHEMLGDIILRIQKVDSYVYRVTGEDTGPGIPIKDVPYVFGRFLYGSKFHALKQTRGQQGIGISAVVLYSQLTTGEPATIISKTKRSDPYLFKVFIDVKRNAPIIVEKRKIQWHRDHGLRVTVTLDAQWTEKVLEYVKYSSLVSPYARVVLYTPDGNLHLFKRRSRKVPEKPKMIPIHPHGIELGIFLRMMREYKQGTVIDFLKKTFYGISDKIINHLLSQGISKEILQSVPSSLRKEDAEKIWKVLQKTKIRAISSRYLQKIDEKEIEKSLFEEFHPEVVYSTTRKPCSYRGIPFQVQVFVAYGGNIERFTLIRIANKIPLLYEQSSCAITKAVQSINWKTYGIPADDRGFPKAPMLLLVTINSAWVPYTSESKMAVASYPEILKEVELGVREVARKLQRYIREKERKGQKWEKFLDFVRYGIEISRAFQELFGEDPSFEICKAISKKIFGDVLSDYDIELILKGKFEKIKKKILTQGYGST